MSKTAAAVNDNLDSLSNNELRTRCVEYGLPNIPITDTSRKLLIKRLRVAIEGGGGGDNKATPAKGKPRRETIHVVAKAAEPERESSPKKSRGTRRTIAALGEPEPDEPKVEVTVRELPNRRRSRTTPTPADPIPAVTPGKRKAAAIIEDAEDDDDSDVVLIAETELGPITRSSRSPSLAKSKMVTTSYQHVIAEEPIREPSPRKQREIIIPVRREAVGFEQTKSNVHANERELPTTTTSSLFSRPLVQLSRPSLAASNSSYSSQTTRRYTTAGYKPQTEYSSISSTTHNYKPQTTTAAYRYEAENSEDNEDDEDDALEAPYLSDFARRLSRLKADPLSPSRGVQNRDGSHYRDSQRFYTTSISARRGINNKDSLGESIRKLWFALDRQYGLRKYLAVVAITLVLLFLYIMLVQN